MNMRPVSAYRFGLTIPHWITRTRDTGTLIVPSDMVLTDCDVLVNEYNTEVMVTEILERRKARGDWRENPYDTAPDYVKVRFL
jgi:hypothetical protein